MPAVLPVGLDQGPRVRHFYMPVSGIFKRFASRNAPRQDASPASNAPKDQEKGASSKALVTAAVFPMFPDNLKQARQSQGKRNGVERFPSHEDTLNR